MISAFDGHAPRLGPDVFVAADATLLGDVSLAPQSSIWYGAVLRGDIGHLRIGARTNVQDGSVLHTTRGSDIPGFDGDHHVHVSHDVTIGHRAVLHGCRIGHHVLVGMGAIVMDGAHVEPYTIVAAGALVPPGMVVPGGCLAMGSPAKVVRRLSQQERRHIDYAASHYVQVAVRHRRLALGS